MPPKGVALAVIFILQASAIAAARADMHIPKLQLRERVLPPLAHTVFCVQYPDDCKATTNTTPANSAFLLKSATDLYDDLQIVNDLVNSSIQSTKLPKSALNRWQLSPSFGDCNDYAVTKRHALLRRGWPSWALLLAEVKLNSGEHHLILVANAQGQSFVLDNLKRNVTPFTDVADYQWIRIEAADDPKLWIDMKSR